MLKSIFITCCLLISTYQISAVGTEKEPAYLPNVYCTPQLLPSLITIQKLPEARELIANIQKEGPLQLRLGNMAVAEQFGACWDPSNRIIFVNPAPNRSVIGSILFELQNAFITSKLDQLDHLASQGKISRDSYVEAVERLEYQNSLNAASLARKGIQMKLYPRDALMPTYPTFEEHYRLQKIGGHSAWIANTYNNIAPKGNAQANYRIQ
jgi:hypothetical protein